MSHYYRGRRAEWIIRDKLRDLGFLVSRVAGSKTYDLIIGGFPVEVKLRTSPLKSIYKASAAPIADNGWIAAPWDAYFLQEALLVTKSKIPESVTKLVPACGLLVIYVPRHAEIVVSTQETRSKILALLTGVRQRPSWYNQAKRR